MKKKWLAMASAVVMCMAMMTTGNVTTVNAEPYPGDCDYLYPGDVNLDSEFTVLDVVIVQRWLHGNDVNTASLMNADFTNDGIIDVFDLALMKRELLKSYT
ncbi:MAG: dockerin type I repeat-containing protein, partial [Oscillospiraceae bacterium]|nr:dockerin type I repeat-containing protein [Oscillospiraceae bacterium]